MNKYGIFFEMREFSGNGEKWWLCSYNDVTVLKATGSYSSRKFIYLCSEFHLSKKTKTNKQDIANLVLIPCRLH